MQKNARWKTHKKHQHKKPAIKWKRFSVWCAARIRWSIHSQLNCVGAYTLEVAIQIDGQVTHHLGGGYCVECIEVRCCQHSMLSQVSPLKHAFGASCGSSGEGGGTPGTSRWRLIPLGRGWGPAGPRSSLRDVSDGAAVVVETSVFLKSEKGLSKKSSEIR